MTSTSEKVIDEAEHVIGRTKDFINDQFVTPIREAPINFLRDNMLKLQRILSKLHDLPGSPMEAIRRIAETVSEAIETASEPPGPAPEAIDASAAGWKRLQSRFNDSSVDISQAQVKVGIDIWEGKAADAFRGSTRVMGMHLETVVAACAEAQGSLAECSDQIAEARAKYDDAIWGLREIIRIIRGSYTLEDFQRLMRPDELGEYLRKLFDAAANGIASLRLVYEQAAEAVEQCEHRIRGAMDSISLPATMTTALSAYDQVNQFTSTGRKSPFANDGLEGELGPLRGSVVSRAEEAMRSMSPEDRAALTQLLMNSQSEDHKSWLMSAVASGLSTKELAAFSHLTNKMSEQELAKLDPTRWDSGTFKQPDANTCGTSALVMAKMTNNPAYALWIQTGYDVTGKLPIDLMGTPEERFAQVSQDTLADLKTAWPKRLGVLPEDAARQMAEQSGVPGAEYRAEYINPYDAGPTYDEIHKAVDEGHVVPFYVYGIGEPDAGAHVTLVVGNSGDDMLLYEPGSGEYRTINREDFVQRNLRDVTWSTPLAAVLPSHLGN